MIWDGGLMALLAQNNFDKVYYTKNNIHSFHLSMISGNCDEAWPMYLVWPISERFMLGQSGGTWPACCHWPNTGRVDARCPIMSVLTQSYQCGTWFVCSILRELAVSNLGQPLFCLSITWSRCRNAYRDLWIMTIGPFLAEIYHITYLILKIQGQGHKENWLKSHQVIHKSLIQPKIKENQNFLRSYCLNKSLQLAAALLAYKLVQNHQVTPSIPRRLRSNGHGGRNPD